MVISSVLNSSSFNSQESGLVMEAVEATQFNDLNETMDKSTVNGIPIPDSGKNAHRNSQQRRKKRAQKRVMDRYCSKLPTNFRSLGVIMYILLSGNPPFFVECNTDCGWERGDFCQLCQDLLFNSIQEGIYDFPENEWSYISDDAKDLIQHLLVKDASQRYTAEMVLNHRWVAQGGPVTPLETPSVMRKNNSYKDLAAFTNGANQIKRLILNQQNLSSDFNSPLANHIEEEQCVGSYKKNSSSSSLTLTGYSSPTSFELNFTSDEDGDAFLSDLDQQKQQKDKPATAVESNNNNNNNNNNNKKIESVKKAEIKTVKWVDLQEADDEMPAMVVVSPPKKSALKTSSSSIESNSNTSNNVLKKKKKKKTINRNSKTGSTTTSSSDESSSSDYNNVDGEDADIDEAEVVGSNSDDDKLTTNKQLIGSKSKLQKMLECIENRKKLSFSASCYVISNKNNQTASLNFCPAVKSMLII